MRPIISVILVQYLNPLKISNLILHITYVAVLVVNIQEF